MQFDKALPPEQLKLDVQGRLTPETIALMQERFPGLDAEKLRSQAYPAVLQGVLSVQVVFNCLKNSTVRQPAPPHLPVRCSLVAIRLFPFAYRHSLFPHLLFP